MRTPTRWKRIEFPLNYFTAGTSKRLSYSRPFFFLFFSFFPKVPLPRPIVPAIARNLEQCERNRINSPRFVIRITDKFYHRPARSDFIEFFFSSSYCATSFSTVYLFEIIVAAIVRRMDCEYNWRRKKEKNVWKFRLFLKWCPQVDRDIFFFFLWSIVLKNETYNNNIRRSVSSDSFLPIAASAIGKPNDQIFSFAVNENHKSSKILLTIYWTFRGWFNFNSIQQFTSARRSYVRSFRFVVLH